MNEEFDMRIVKQIMASALLAATLGIAGQAHASERLLDGLYVVEVYHHPPGLNSPPPKFGGCMITGNNGHASVPSLFYWSGNFHGWGQCGLSDSRAVVLQNAQAVWRVYTVVGTDGQSAYVIKSHVNGRCLVRGENGHAKSPNLYLWTGLGGDDKFCGLRSADELLRNGQAAWTLTFDDGTDMTGGVGKAPRIRNPEVGDLAFWPMPEAWPQPYDQFVPAVFLPVVSPWVFDFIRVGS
jgi:hypothetical protein